MSSFSSLNLGSRAIYAAQKGLDVTGQNIANSATPGYSRQRVDQVAVGGPTVPAIWAKYDQAGGGVKVTGISRVRDEFLEARARGAHSSVGQLEEQQKTYEAIERTIDEPSDKAFKKMLTEFWNGWSDAGNDLKSEAPRRVVVERGVAAAERLNHMATQLETQWADRRVELSASVTEVNAAARDIAKLNRAIRNNVINGLPANELADQRDQLVEKVTTLTGAVAERTEDGVVDVKLGGSYLVQGRTYREIGVAGGGDTYAAWTSATPAKPPATIGWASALTDATTAATPTNPGLAANAISTFGAGASPSRINGQLEAINTTIPDYLTQLDDTAMGLAALVNGQQALGYTVGGAPGADVLTDAGGGALAAARAAVNIRFSGGAADIAVSKGNPAGVPAAPPAPAIAPILDGDNAKAMAQLGNTVNGPDDKYRSLVIQLGVEAQSVYRNKGVADNVAKTADDARDSVSGVSLNEEMTNLMQYQHSFSAAAKFITTIDATIETLLNMTR